MRLRSVVFKALSLLALASGCKRESEPAIPLWEDGAPGSRARRHEVESVGPWWVANVHHPSLTPFVPERGSANGAAVIIMPGGGHERLVYGPEGVAPAKFLAARGFTAFVLKYRLAREKGSTYRIEEHARADAFRAVRWVRHHARNYGIDPERVGVMGWSAGGELAAFVGYGDGAAGDPAARDPVDRHDARPSFQIMIYPGSRGLPAELPHDAPPVFLLAASDDTAPAETVTRLHALYRAAGRPAELHLFVKGGHGFNMGERSPYRAIRRWPERLEEWLLASGLSKRR